MNKKGRSLIVGSVRRLSCADLYPFVESLRSTGYSGDCVFFSTSMSRSSLSYLHDHGIQTIPFYYPAIRNHQPLLYGWSLWKLLLNKLKSRELRLKIARLVWDLFFIRFLFARNFLTAHAEYSQVMLTDVRDVVFQRDPFAWMENRKGVFCFEEKQGRTIGECNSNSRMVREIFGEEGWTEMRKCQISCAGVTFGTRVELLEYLERFLDLSLDALSLRPCSGSDQGVHNRVVHFEKLGNLALLDNEGPVFTMGCVSQEFIRVNAAGEVVNRQGDVYSVLHQYDRFPELAKRFRSVQ
jgi:hypothetical protein